MFSHVLRAPICFFDTNPIGKRCMHLLFQQCFQIGRILNRFSKDVGFMDDILITKLVSFTMVSLKLFTIITFLYL